MKYFVNVTTLEELKKQYRRLAMIHHPDCGGSTEAMQEVNDEHDRLFEILKKQHNERAAADTTGKTRATTETPEEFRRIVDLLLHLDGLDIELCGSWLWIGGNTKQHKEELKKLVAAGPTPKSCGIGDTKKRAVDGPVVTLLWGRSATSTEAIELQRRKGR